MRRDLCHYFRKDIKDVYNAYLQVISVNFNKDYNATPYHTISFGLNFSFRYNMNGGACTIHLMPYCGGKAIDVRYSLVQGVGARYKAHDSAMTNYVENILKIRAEEINIPVEEFLKESNQVGMGYTQPVASVPLNIPPVQNTNAVPDMNVTPTMNPTPNTKVAKFCSQCGNAFSDRDIFCTNCGAKR